MGINEDGRAFHALAKEKGWWDDPALEAAKGAIDARLKYMLDDLDIENDASVNIRIVISRLLEDHWPARNVGELMMLMVSEIAEAFEEYRAGKLDTIYQKDGKPEGGPIEMADLYIRLGDFAASRGMDLEYAISKKHQFNTTRPHRHGGKLA